MVGIRKDEDIVYSLSKDKGPKGRLGVAPQYAVFNDNTYGGDSLGKFRDLSGQKYGMLTVVSRADNQVGKDGKSRVRWNCVCDCGKSVTVLSDNLLSGRQVSCGCFHKKKMNEMLSTHNMSESRLYNVWNSIKQRCFNERSNAYHLYGGRGISMCDEWRYDYMSFYDWAISNGYDESAKRGIYTVDRIDCNGNYCPENCRLATQKEQMNNVRYNKRIEYNGESHTYAEWSEITGISQYKIRQRYCILGWDAKRTLETA